MISHSAVKDGLLDITNRLQVNDHAALTNVRDYLQNTPAGPELNATVKRYLQPAASAIATKNIMDISALYPDYHLTELYDNVPENELPAIWQQLGMINMLLSTMDMVPPQMLTQIETMTNTMMTALQSGSNSDTPDLSSFAQGLAGMLGGSQQPPARTSQRERNRGASKNKLQKFRNDLC